VSHLISEWNIELSHCHGRHYKKSPSLLCMHVLLVKICKNMYVNGKLGLKLVRKLFQDVDIWTLKREKSSEEMWRRWEKIMDSKCPRAPTDFLHAFQSLNNTDICMYFLTPSKLNSSSALPPTHLKWENEDKIEELNQSKCKYWQIWKMHQNVLYVLRFKRASSIYVCMLKYIIF
jgi:hypothetical protein